MCAVLAFLLAVTAGAPTFEVEADHSNCLYRAGERVEFSVRVDGVGYILSSWATEEKPAWFDDISIYRW